MGWRNTISLALTLLGLLALGALWAVIAAGGCTTALDDGYGQTAVVSVEPQSLEFDLCEDEELTKEIEVQGLSGQALSLGYTAQDQWVHFEPEMEEQQEQVPSLGHPYYHYILYVTLRGAELTYGSHSSKVSITSQVGNAEVTIAATRMVAEPGEYGDYCGYPADEWQLLGRPVSVLAPSPIPDASVAQ